MKIAMISMHTSPLATLGGKETGGMNVYVRELSRGLAARGLQVDIFTRNRSSETDIVSHDLAPGVRVVDVPAGPAGPLSKHRLYRYVPHFAEGIRAWADREQLHYDLFHGHYWLSGATALELQRTWPATPLVQMFHTLGAMKNQVAREEGERESAERIRVEGELMRAADRLIASTPRDRDQMAGLYGADPSRIAVIHPGVNLDLFHPVDSHRAKDYVGSFYDDRTVLFVGRLDPVKGIDTWFRAMKLAVEKDPPLRFKLCVCLIGGDVDEDESPDAEFARLDALREELGIGDIVTFLGKRSQESLPFYYSAADVVVMPSRYESFGLVALEAMACGTPVIASDVGGLSFIVRNGENGFLVPEGNPEALSECVLLVLHDRTLRDRLGQNGVAAAQEYAWPVIAELIADLYTQVLGGRAA